MKYLVKLLNLALCFAMAILLAPAYSFATDVGAGITIDANVADVLNFDAGEATATVNGNYNIAGDGAGKGITTANIGTGTLTYNSNFTGSGSVAGGIGGGLVAINAINLNGTGVLTLSSLGNVSAVGGINFGADGQITLGSGKAIISTTSVDNTSGLANKGTLTFEGGNQSIAGSIGATNALKVINAQAGSGETATFSQTVNAQTINITDLGTASFVKTVTGALKFTSATSNGGVVTIGSNNLCDITGTVDNTSGSTNKGTLTLAGTYSVFIGVTNQSISGNVGATNALYAVNAQAGSNYTNTFNGTVNAQTINVTGVGTAAFADNITGALKFTSAASNGGTVTVANGKTITGNVTTDNDGKGTLTFLGATTTGGTIGSYADTKELYIVNFNGATTLGHNIAAATTNIKAGSTTTLSGNRTINGDLTLAADATAILDVGANTLTLATGTASGGTGIYTQNNNSKLKVTIDSASTSGKVSSGANAVVSATSNVDVTIANDVYIPSNAAFTIIDAAGGTGVNVPGAITSSSSRVAFQGQSLNGDLILTANRSSSGFSSLAVADSNASSAGNALDNVTNPTSDMTTILNTLEGLSDSQAASALDTMVPTVDAGVLNNSTAALNNFVGASLERTQDVLTLAAAENSATGISSGDESRLNGIWAKGYGSYLDQGTRNDIKGYNAWNTGTAIGADRLFSDALALGISSGYAYGKVNSDVNDANTNIDSAQGTICAGYQDLNRPYFIDAAASFAWNWYNGKRDISVGAINRTAHADYDGQQYGVYLDGGYKFNLKKNLEFTPLASIQWNQLRLARYTETEAGSMNLDVDGQAYDMLQSGIGARAASHVKCKWGNFTPEVHARWLYDFIGDDVVCTSTYTGGGGSFASNGAKPDKSSINLGGKLSFDLKNDISLIAECDTEMKDEFFGVYGSAALRYKF